MIHVARGAGASALEPGSAVRETSSLGVGFRLSPSGWRYPRLINRYALRRGNLHPLVGFRHSSADCSARLVR